MKEKSTDYRGGRGATITDCAKNPIELYLWIWLLEKKE